MSFLPIYRNRKIGPNTNGRNSLLFVDIDTNHEVPATIDILAQEDAEWEWHWDRGWIYSRIISRFSQEHSLECNAYGMAITVAWGGWSESQLKMRANILFHNYAKERISEQKCLEMILQYRSAAEYWCDTNRSRIQKKWEDLI